MEKIPVFVGLDYHKDSVQVCVLDGGGKVLGNRTCDNDPRRVVEYVATHGGVAAGEGGVAVKGDVHGDITVGAPKKNK